MVSGAKSLPARESIPGMPTKSVLQVEVEQPAAPVEEAMRAKANENDQESCTRLTWDDGVEQLKAFKFKFGHVDVPTAYLEENERLRNFVKSIRERYKNIQEGQMNGNKLLSHQRISELERMGFKLQVQVRHIIPWEQRFEELMSVGEMSSLGLKRIGLLNSIGFDWRLDTNDEVTDHISVNADQGR